MYCFLSQRYWRRWWWGSLAKISNLNVHCASCVVHESGTSVRRRPSAKAVLGCPGTAKHRVHLRRTISPASRTQLWRLPHTPSLQAGPARCPGPPPSFAGFAYASLSSPIACRHPLFSNHTVPSRKQVQKNVLLLQEEAACSSPVQCCRSVPECYTSSSAKWAAAGPETAGEGIQL